MSTKEKNEKKEACFVVDTSLLVHDPNAISVLGKDANVHIPIGVLSELGRLTKYRSFDIQFVASEALKKIEELRGDNAIFNGGIPIPGTDNKLHIDTVMRHSDIYNVHPDGKSNHSQIIATCKELEKKYKKVSLVSKDPSLSLQAAAMSIKSISYGEDVVKCYQGVEYLEQVPKFDALTPEQQIANRFFFEKNNDELFTVLHKNKKIEEVTKAEMRKFGIVPKNIEQAAMLWALLEERIKFVSAQGPAGVGKTFDAILAGIVGLYGGRYDKVIITRSIISVDGDELGALPGNAEEKLSPYMAGVWDNIEVIKELVNKHESKTAGSKKFKDIFDPKNKKIEAVPFNLMRGRSLNNILLVVDEAQNITHHAMKTLITRIADSSKIVIMGDNAQIDNPYLDARSNGMVKAINHFKDFAGAAHITLTSNERGAVSRHASLM